MYNLKEIIISSIQKLKSKENEGYNIKCSMIESKAKLDDNERK